MEVFEPEEGHYEVRDMKSLEVIVDTEYSEDVVVCVKGILLTQLVNEL